MADKDLTEVKVQVARIDERVEQLIRSHRDLREAQDAHRGESSKALAEIARKIDHHNDTIHKYKNDRNWIVGLFGAAYAFVLVWVKSKIGGS